jgi:pimeloyl-ACP methyl ester carboxylesterase
MISKDVLMDRSTSVNGISLHYLDHPGKAGPIVLLHGLSANAHSFDQIVASGLSPAFRVLALDLRGRGGSDKPPTGYSIEEHAEDVTRWLEGLGIGVVFLAGHSYGAFLAAYIAERRPDLVKRLVLLDVSHSAARSPRVGELLRPSLGRLSRRWASREDFLAEMKEAPFLRGRWTPAVESYLATDVEQGADGQVWCRTPLAAVVEAARDGALIDWASLMARIQQPSLLICATEPFGESDATPIVLPDEATATAALMRNCRVVPVPGNHLTMLFGEGASRISAALHEFLADG